MKTVWRQWGKQGFTLIEILVVISIIGILSTILFASFGEARNDSRNKALQAELKEVQLALELYKAQNGRYPAPYSTGVANCMLFGSLATAKASVCGTDDILPALIPDFIAELPKRSDSGNSACDIVYKTDTSGTWYKLTAEHCAAGVDGTTGIQAGDEFARCLTTFTLCNTGASDFYESYAVYSLGGECQL